MSLQFKAIIAALTVAMAFASGWTAQGWRKDAQLLKAATAAQEAATAARVAVREREAATDLAQLETAVVAARKRQEIKIVERVITNDVIRYVQKSDSNRCGVDADGVRILDTAAAGRLPEDTSTAPAPDDATSGATAGEIVASVTGNYSTCHQTAAQLAELQSWVSGLSNLINP